MKYFRLIPTIETKTKISVVRKENGRMVHGYASLHPNEWYELEEDELFQRTLLENAIVKRSYSQVIAKSLEENNIPYEVVRCPSCGGVAKKLEYSLLEVKEDE